MSDNDLSDTEFDLEQEENELDENESEDQNLRIKGNWIYENYSSNTLREETLSFLSHYMKHKENRILTEEEIHKRSTINNIFYPEIYMNLISMFITSLVDKGLKTTFDDLMNDKLGWNHPVFEEIKMNEEKEVNKRLKPVEIKEGIYTCKKCGGKRTQSYEVQLRRADEPATVFIECVNPKCRNKWSIN